MPAYKADPRVDAYIKALPEWQQKVFQKLRDLVHEADPDVEETVKRRVQPYFTLNGNICAFLGTKKYADVFLYDPTVPDPKKIINLGLGNKTGRGIQISEGEKLNEKALLEIFRAIIANNRAGGWRKLV